METDFRQFVKQHRMLHATDRILLAVSGGIDSMTMLRLMPILGHTCALAHVNFGLRGAASDADQALVEAEAAAMGLECHVQRFDTKVYAKTRGVSVQMAARELRYSWFQELAERHGYHKIATAHHSGDLLETMLLNLSRGTGLSGLRGIRPVQGNIIRPLLFADRPQLERYAQTQGLRWREDASNRSTNYARNLLRLKVLPILQQLNPALPGAALTTATHLAAAERLLHQTLDAQASKVCKEQAGMLYIEKAGLRDLPEPALLLHHLLHPYGFKAEQLAQITTSGQTGTLVETPSHMLLNDRNCWILQRKAEVPNLHPITIHADGTQVQTPYGKLTLAWQPVPPKLPVTSPQEAWLDTANLQFPLKLRLWQKGDKLCPLGMKGRSKKVSDLLIDAKLNRLEKARTLVLENADGELVWLVGQRISETFKLQPHSQKALYLRWN